MYPATTARFNFKNCEMLFVHIKKFRMFEDQLIPLNPRYDVTFEDSRYIVRENSEYVDLFERHRLHVIAICGRNGVGKTTFLRLLRGRFLRDADYILCWRDHTGAFACSQNAEVNFCGQNVEFASELHNFSQNDLCGNSNLGDTNHPRNKLVEVYNSNRQLFDLDSKPVFDGFHLDFKEENCEWDDLEEQLLKIIQVRDSYGRFQKIVRESPVMHVFALLARDSTFKDLTNAYPRLRTLSFSTLWRFFRDDESETLDLEIRKLLYEDGNRGPLITHKIEEGGLRVGHFNDPNWKRYDISEFDSVQRSLISISSRFDAWVQRKLSSVKMNLWERFHINLHLGSDWLLEIIEFKPIRIRENKIQNFYDLSDGEQSRISMQFSIVPMMLPDYACWFHFDDADARLHPEWKRNLVGNIVTTYEEFSKQISRIRRSPLYRERVMTCIITTHSPFVLSDLPRNCVLQFIGQDGENTEVQRSESATFAGNIGEMFHTEFFMDSTIGEFARGTIKKMIRRLERNPTFETINQARELFSIIGDDVLRNLLFEKLRDAKNRIDPTEN